MENRKSTKNKQASAVPVSASSPLILAIETSGRLGSVAIALGEKLLGEKQFSGPMRHSAEIFPDIVGLLEQFSKKPADLEQVYISIGPGSFTGLRIAVTIAKSMALANQTKLVRRPFGGIVAVDTLDCIAANVINLNDVHEQSAIRSPWRSLVSARRNPKPLAESRFGETQSEISRLAVILDAKRGQFFIAVYEKTQDRNWGKTLPDCLMTADEFLARFTDKPISLIGEGLVYYRNNFNAPNIQILDEKYWNPSASNVHKLGRQKALRGEFADPLTLVPNYIRGPDVKLKIKN
jgi:tRNA threonylcarbamoyladenosine biosynthesis protein TsaB